MAASYISVPRDLTKVKSKVMFNLTKRQLICFGMAVLIGVPSFFLMKTVMKTNTAVMGMMVIMMPFFFMTLSVKMQCRTARRPSGIALIKIRIPLFIARAKRRPFKIVSRSPSRTNRRRSGTAAMGSRSCCQA